MSIVSCNLQPTWPNDFALSLHSITFRMTPSQSPTSFYFSGVACQRWTSMSLLFSCSLLSHRHVYCTSLLVWDSRARWLRWRKSRARWRHRLRSTAQSPLSAVSGNKRPSQAFPSFLFRIFCGSVFRAPTTQKSSSLHHQPYSWTSLSKACFFP